VPGPTSLSRKGWLVACLIVFLAANIIFPKYLPNTPFLGYVHFAVIALSGGAALWLLFTRPRPPAA
jgi:hypothetical protein